MAILNSTQAAFLSATVTDLARVRDSGGTVTGISFTLLLRDDAITEQVSCGYLITGTEFSGLPVGVAAQKAALIAIAKREGHFCYNRWIAERTARAQPPQIRDPLTDLGATSFSSFAGEASPLPTP